MKFGEIFEYHKIPEWYNMYLNYELFKQKIELFQLKKKFNEVVRLPGYYVRTSDGQLIKLDLTSRSKKDENKNSSLQASVDKMIENSKQECLEQEQIEEVPVNDINAKVI